MSTVKEAPAIVVQSSFIQHIVLEIYEQAAVHLNYPPTYLQLYEDYHDMFRQELIYFISNKNLYKEVGVRDFNELHRAVYQDNFPEYILSKGQLRVTLQQLLLYTSDYKNKGVW